MIVLVVGEGDLALLGAPHQLMAQLVGPQAGEARELAAWLAVELEILQLAGGIQAVETALGTDVIDGGGVPEQGMGQWLAGLEGLVHAEQRHHALHGQADVEVVAPDALAAVTEQIAAAIQLVTVARAHAQYGAVGGPAPDVHHQHHRILGEARFELEAGGHRLIEELHPLEPGEACRLPQDGDGLAVALFPRQSLEVDRSADHRLADGAARLLLRLPAHVQHHGADNVLEQGDLGSLEAIGPEKGFGGLDVVALVRLFQIARQRRTAEAQLVDESLFAHLAAHRLGPGHHGTAQLEVFALLDGGQPFGQEAGDGVPVGGVQGGGKVMGTGEGQQPGAALFHHGDGTVGGTVIKSDEHAGQTPVQKRAGSLPDAAGSHNPAAGSMAWRQRLRDHSTSLSERPWLSMAWMLLRVVSAMACSASRVRKAW